MKHFVPLAFPRFFPVVAGVAQVMLYSACEPTLVVGTWDCAQSPAGESDAGMTTTALPITLPWSTGFENGFCDFAPPVGFCYSPDYASYRLVTAPVHSGNYAAAFTVNSDPNRRGPQSRCVRDGILPESAYYGAHYLIPETRQSTANWNLFHFQGGPAPGEDLHGLWDLSLVNDAEGGVRLRVLDAMHGDFHETSGVPSLPIGSWVHLQFYLKRAADESGEVAVYQDGKVALHLSNIVTDDSTWAQWYVGNLADELQPFESTVYVDDITIQQAP